MHKIIFFFQKKNNSKKKQVCLPNLNFSDPLPTTHLFFYLAIAAVCWFNQFKLSGLYNPYQLDESISSFRVVGCDCKDQDVEQTAQMCRLVYTIVVCMQLRFCQVEACLLCIKICWAPRVVLSLKDDRFINSRWLCIRKTFLVTITIIIA